MSDRFASTLHLIDHFAGGPMQELAGMSLIGLHPFGGPGRLR